MTVLSLLLQINEISPGDEESLSLLVLLTKGGYMMIPLIILWITAIYIFIERILVLKHASKTHENFQNDIREKVQAGAINEAKLAMKENEIPVGSVLVQNEKIIANGATTSSSILEFKKIIKQKKSASYYYFRSIWTRKTISKKWQNVSGW